MQVQEEQGPSHRGSAVLWRKQLAERLQLQRSKMDVPHIDEEGLMELPAPGIFLPLGAVPVGSETEQRAAVRNGYMLTATGFVPDRVTTFVSGRPVQAIAVNTLVLHKYVLNCVLLLLHARVLALIAEGPRPRPCAGQERRVDALCATPASALAAASTVWPQCSCRPSNS